MGFAVRQVPFIAAAEAAAIDARARALKAAATLTRRMGKVRLTKEAVADFHRKLSSSDKTFMGIC